MYAKPGYNVSAQNACTIDAKMYASNNYLNLIVWELQDFPK